MSPQTMASADGWYALYINGEDYSVKRIACWVSTGTAVCGLVAKGDNSKRAHELVSAQEAGNGFTKYAHQDEHEMKDLLLVLATGE